MDLAGLSAEDIAILCEPNPYSYESENSLSPFVQVMRQQEALFYAAFPEAKRVADLRQRRKADILAFLAARVIYHDVPALVPAFPSQPHPPDPPPKSPVHPHPSPSPTPVPAPAPAPAPSSSSSHTPRSRTNKAPKNGLAWCAKRRSAASSTAVATRPTPTVPGKRQQQSDRKPTLACLFCRGRKIACGQPLPGSVDKTCKQVVFFFSSSFVVSLALPPNSCAFP